MNGKRKSMNYSRKITNNTGSELYEILFNRVKTEMKDKHPEVQLKVKTAIGDICNNILRELKNAPLAPVKK